jgi:ABC-type transport system involved in cytochrome c biogenesis permease component
VSVDAKNSVFAVLFITALFAALYVGSLIEGGLGVRIVPLIIPFMIGLAHWYVMTPERQDNDNG